MNNYLTDKFYIISRTLYIIIPFLIISGNFLSNFLAIYSLIFLFYVILKYKNIKILFNKEILYLTIFFIYLIINAIINNNEYTTIATLKYLRFYFFCLSFYYLFYFDDQFYRQLLLLFLISIIILIIDGFYQYFFDVNLIGMKKYVVHRTSSFFGKELILGSFVAKYIFFIILFFLDNKKYYFLFIPFLFLSILLTFISGERAAFATIIMISFFTILKFYNYKKILLFITLITSFLFILINIDDNLKERMIVSIFKDVELIQEWNHPKKLKIFTKQHNAHFQSAYLMFKKGDITQKLFGRGIKSFRQNCNNKEFCDSINCCSTHPHNIFFQILSEIGLIGLFFYLYFLLYLFYNSIIYYRKNNNIDYIILITILINYSPFLTSGNIFGTFLSINIYILISFLIYLNNKKNTY